MVSSAQLLSLLLLLKCLRAAMDHLHWDLLFPNSVVRERGQACGVHNGPVATRLADLHLPPRLVRDLLHRRQLILHHRAEAEIYFRRDPHAACNA